ncbi:hypothetical protein HELRODRAFT_183058 [Helobdella robusta]|uniref:Uncharacterized protein n=1 Tax=Helobdella robusta TaxID=6412 RepID=T1FJ41_HELRO|nr:hypothetical protein HELRODRAFT_183058 [Helobdella robusta]ESN89853.1 hypothetical protein HELRODRAFT_183058 [Helobdella robusta]
MATLNLQFKRALETTCNSNKSDDIDDDDNHKTKKLMTHNLDYTVTTLASQNYDFTLHEIPIKEYNNKCNKNINNNTNGNDQELEGGGEEVEEEEEEDDDVIEEEEN